MTTSLPLRAFIYFLVLFGAFAASMEAHTSKQARSHPRQPQRGFLQRRASSSDSWSPEDKSTNPRVAYWKEKRPSLGKATAAANRRPKAVIPFQQNSELKWRPLEIHPVKFQLKDYPLDDELFQHFYAPDGTVPSSIDVPNSKEGFKLKVRPIRFRPELELLESTRSAIWYPLTNRGVSAQAVDPDEKYFFEGMYLFPPLEVDRNGYRFPASVLENRAAQLPRNSYLSHQASDMYHLWVETSQGYRHILMSRAPEDAWTTREQESEKSKLWVFFEGRQFPPELEYFEGKLIQKPSRGKKMLSLMGVTYLPKNAPEILLQSGVIEHFVPF